MAKIYKLQKVEMHSLNKYYAQDVTEDQLRHIFAHSDLDESEHDDMLEALEDSEHPRHFEAWDILREDEYFNDGWEWTEDDLWTDRKGGYDVEETVEEVFDDGSDETLN